MGNYRSRILRPQHAYEISEKDRQEPSSSSISWFRCGASAVPRTLKKIDPPRLSSDLEEWRAEKRAYRAFLETYPQYKLTAPLDRIRKKEFSRLIRRNETYLDYMGGALYPERLIRWHAEFLQRSVLGNTHSVNPSSTLSTTYAIAARASVLSFFDAGPEYTVVFTPNATGALKLIGESYPFQEGGTLVLAADSHNSVHGLRAFGMKGGAQVCYVESGDRGGFDEVEARTLLTTHRRASEEQPPALFVLTGQSNITNSKAPLSIISHAAAEGFHTMLDAAALAPTSRVSLKETPVDAMAISFYKMFGFPTGVGALVVKKSFLKLLSKPWFAGGSVEVVQVPGKIVTDAEEPHERFEDGTINYLSLPAITEGLKFLGPCMPLLPLRLSVLLHHLCTSLAALRYPNSDQPVVRILSNVPEAPLTEPGQQASHGFLVSLIFLSPENDMLSLSFIEHAASRRGISLRSGCACNPGGAAALLGVREDMSRLEDGITLEEFERKVGRELGVIRISLGLATCWEDIYKVIEFATAVSDKYERELMWTDYQSSRAKKSMSTV